MTANSTHEDLVNKYISDYFKDKPNTTGLNKKQGALLIDAIRSINQNQKIDPTMRRRIKTRLYTINDKDELLCDNKPVIYIENYYEKINEVHSDMGHPGVTKTFDQINLQYACLPRKIVEYHIKTCSICNLRQRQVNFNQTFIYINLKCYKLIDRSAMTKTFCDQRSMGSGSNRSR